MSNLLTRIAGRRVDTPSPATLWAVRAGLWIAASLVGLTGIMIWLDMTVELLFLDEAVIFGITSALTWIIAKIKGVIHGGWLWVTAAGALLTGQAWMVFLDLTFPTMFFDEVVYFVVNTLMGGIIWKLRGKARKQAQEDTNA